MIKKSRNWMGSPYVIADRRVVAEDTVMQRVGARVAVRSLLTE